MTADTATVGAVGQPTRRWGTTARLAPRILDFLPARAAHVALALGRTRSDGTVRRALRLLEQRGLAERVDGVWRVANDGNPDRCPACGAQLREDT